MRRLTTSAQSWAFVSQIGKTACVVSRVLPMAKKNYGLVSPPLRFTESRFHKSHTLRPRLPFPTEVCSHLSCQFGWLVSFNTQSGENSCVNLQIVVAHSTARNLRLKVAGRRSIRVIGGPFAGSTLIRSQFSVANALLSAPLPPRLEIRKLVRSWLGAG